MKQYDNLLFDKLFRAELLNNPKEAIAKLNYQQNDNVEYKVVTNTKNTVYIVMIDESLLMNIYLGELHAGSVATASTANYLQNYMNYF